MAVSVYTLADLDAAVLTRVEDNSIFFQTQERYAIINEAIKTTNLLTGFTESTVQLISQAGQLVYQIPFPLIFPQRVQFESTQLDPVPITQIGFDYRTWATDTTNKLGPVARWVPIGCNLLALHPTDSLGGGRIYVTGVSEPPTLANPTDKISLSDQYMTIIVEYCASRLPLKIGGTNASQASLLYTKSFIPSVKPLLRYQKYKFPRYFVQAGVPVPEGRIP